MRRNSKAYFLNSSRFTMAIGSNLHTHTVQQCTFAVARCATVVVASDCSNVVSDLIGIPDFYNTILVDFVSHLLVSVLHSH